MVHGEAKKVLLLRGNMEAKPQKGEDEKPRGEREKTKGTREGTCSRWGGTKRRRQK